ncbi:MAG: helix-turn-helix transcriptional regulator [Candidatus Thiodiazotropha lotti]|nr:helix-turn-helix transcriptional regulator [Candidatus Thiodiazotropha lotti]
MTEFTIHGVVCQVLPVERIAEVVDGDLQAETSLHIVGNCTLNGQRYVLICKSDSDQQNGSDKGLASDLLTKRELQVAMMVCEGRGNKQIAHRLHLSEWTVSSYLRRIYAKLGVRTRTAMVASLLCSAGSSPDDGHQLS